MFIENVQKDTRIIFSQCLEKLRQHLSWRKLLVLFCLDLGKFELKVENEVKNTNVWFMKNSRENKKEKKVKIK